MSFRRKLKRWIPGTARKWVRSRVQAQVDESLASLAGPDELWPLQPAASVPDIGTSRADLRRFQDDLQELTRQLVQTRQKIEESQRISQEANAQTSAAKQLSERVGARLASASRHAVVDA